MRALRSALLDEDLEVLGDDGDESSDECGVFQASGLAEITLPRALEGIGLYAFADCVDLRTIRVEDGCSACLYQGDVPEATTIQPLSVTKAGNARVLDLRDLRLVVIPDGVERVGNHWFWGCGVEEVVVPACVREIGT